jgi:uncharacterized protein DUF29
MTDLKALYERDTVAWSEQQAAALRAAARGGSNQLLDWENLAEEIESLGRSLRLGLRSQLVRIIQHLLKLAHSPTVEPRSGWRRSIRQARVEVDLILDDSPSLRRELPRFIKEDTERAVQLAIRDLEEHDELSRLELPTLKKATFTEVQVLGDWFPAEPPGSGGKP